jgi:archaemetzincin
MVLLGVSAFGIFAAGEAPEMERIIIVPVGGDISAAEIEFLVQPLKETFGASVGFESRVPLPANAYNRHRKQYLSNMILDVLNSRVRVPENSRVLGVTNEDLYVPDLNFVLGQADTYTGVAILSLARLRPQFYGQPPDEPLFHERAITEAVHEIGHTGGLIDHCPDSKCVMHFSNSLADTDIKGHRFCIKCRRILGL